jgi:hypothetical protein
MGEAREEGQIDIERRYRITASLVSGMALFSILLAVAAWFLAGLMAGRVDPSSLSAIWVLVLFIAAAAFVLRRVLFRWERLRDVKLLKGNGGVLTTLQANALILAALAETIALAGFIASLLGGEWFDMVRAGAVSLIVFAVVFPRRSMWIKIFNALEGV